MVHSLAADSSNYQMGFIVILSIYEMGFGAHNRTAPERRLNMSLAKDSVRTVVTTAAPALVTHWDLDPSHSIAQFGVRHMMISTVRGAFEKVSGHVALDEADLTRSTVEIS